MPEIAKQLYGEFVWLSIEQYDKLVVRFGEADTADRIARLDEYLGAKGVKYLSHYHVILMWARRDGERRPGGGPGDVVDRWVPGQGKG